MLDSNETKQKILTEFLRICICDGWSKEAFTRALENCEIDKNFPHLIFENPLVDLASFYIESQNQKACEIVCDLSAKKLRDKIRLMLYARFEVEKDYKIAIQNLISFYFNPRNFTSLEIGLKPTVSGLSACYKIADFIWKEINDQSTDFNFYTKRITLGKIIFRSVIFFLKNDLEKTRRFIDLEIEKVMQFQKYKSRTKKFLSEICLEEDGSIKSPGKIIKSLPFFRLIKSREF